MALPPRYVGHFLVRTKKNSDLTDYYLTSSASIRMDAEQRMVAIMRDAEFPEAQLQGVYSLVEFHEKMKKEEENGNA